MQISITNGISVTLTCRYISDIILFQNPNLGHIQSDQYV